MAILESQSIAESQQYVEANTKQLEQAVRSNLVIPKLTRKELYLLSRKRVFWATFFGVVGLALLITGSILSSRAGIIGIEEMALMQGGFFTFVFALLAFIFRSTSLSLHKKKVSFDNQKAYIDFFKQNFDNLSVTDFAKEKDIASILRFRPSAVPAHASVEVINLGIQGKIDNFIYSSVWLQWEWSSGGQETSRSQALAGVFTGLNECFDNFSLKFSYPPVSIGKAFRNRAELEISEFEKKTSIESNDDIALRRFLTPRTQELILRDITEKEVNTTQMYVYNKSLIVFQWDNQECFNTNFRISRNHEKMINDFVKDLKDDIAHVISFFSHIHNLETLHRG